MKYSTRLSDAIHILIFIIVSNGQPVTSGQIAESVQTNPACVRQIMGQLKKGGLIESVAGQPRPSLSRDAAAISLLDIYKAVEGDKPFLHVDMHTNEACSVGLYVRTMLGAYYAEVQQAAEARMREITLQEIVDAYYRQRPPL